MAGNSRTQYQHFVPQFLLRNFSHPYKPQKDGRQKTNPSKHKNQKRIYRGDPVVNTLDLSEDLPVPHEARVDRVLGQMDMYRDTSKPSSKQQHIEDMFCNMERQASGVVGKITKAFEQNENGLWLTRQERDLLRKFLFLLKYRGSAFHQRFYHESSESYKADDRELLWEYMAEKGFQRPTDVWFDNLRTIMELHMDPEGKWVHDLPKRMFVDDAVWFIGHVQGMYMAICTPSDPADEFILTDNSYNIFEGPNCYMMDGKTGKVKPAAHAALHEFAPISPKLMIVLRSRVMPSPEEDANPYVKAKRDFSRAQVLDAYSHWYDKSLLLDLPISKAGNNYSEVVDGRVRLNLGEDGTRRKDHKFCFQYFHIDTKHVHIINAILLQNAYVCSRVVFGTQDNLSRTLEAHLTSPWNIISGDDTELRFECLMKLARVSKFLGSEKEPVWRVHPVSDVQDYESYRLKIIEKRRLATKVIRGDWKNLMKNEFMQAYTSLGGTEETLLVDMDQARLMWQFRVKIDAWSRGLDESLRYRNRLLLTESFLRLPPGRVWFFVKHIRLGHLERTTGFETEIDLGSFLDGPENVIARGKYLASHIIRPERLTELMYKATLNEISLKDRPELNLLAKIKEPGILEFMALMLLGGFASTKPEYIRDCGIDEIEQLARNQQLEIVKEGFHDRGAESSILEEEDKIELFTRRRVRSKFVEALSGKVEVPLLKDLKNVFFGIVFPTPG